MLLAEEQDLDTLDVSDKGTVILVSVAVVCCIPKSIKHFFLIFGTSKRDEFGIHLPENLQKQGLFKIKFAVEYTCLCFSASIYILIISITPRWCDFH